MVTIRTDETYDIGYRRGHVIESDNDAFNVAIGKYKDHYNEVNDGGEPYAPAAKLISKTKVARDFGERPFWVYEFECYCF